MKIHAYVIIVCSLLFFTTCKKNTNITVKVFNPALNEYVAGAVVVLLETKDGSLLGGGDCTEIATATTDVNGMASFNNEKLRTKSKYHYKLGIKESWGIAHQNPCGSQTQNYLDVGKSQDVLLMDYLEINYKEEYNPSYLNPSTTGDSLICNIDPIVYYDPIIGHTQGGGGGGYIVLTHNYDYPITSTFYGPIKELFACRFAVTTRKRKMGVVTTTVDTVRAYPGHGDVIIKLNW